MMRTLLLSLGIGGLIASSAVAQDGGVKEKARHLGLAVGKTYTCVPEEDRGDARAEFEEMFDQIYAVDGHEVAFVFAVAIGYGAASEKAENDCSELLAHVNAVKAEMGFGGSDE